MTLKTFSLGLLIALIAAACAAALTLAGNHLLNKDGTLSAKESAWFNASEEKKHVEFVEINRILITLQSNGIKERYLLLELALATNDPKNVERINEMAPAVRGATVSLLSDMQYDEVRSMTVSQLRDKLLVVYEERFKSLNSTMPFQDVIISKMVFQ